MIELLKEKKYPLLSECSYFINSDYKKTKEVNLLALKFCDSDKLLDLLTMNKKFEALNFLCEKGYIAPKLCFWNVNGRVGNIPTTTKSKDVALVSGASPSIIQSLLSGGDFTPQGIMLTTLNNERYNLISEILKLNTK